MAAVRQYASACVCLRVRPSHARIVFLFCLKLLLFRINIFFLFFRYFLRRTSERSCQNLKRKDEQRERRTKRFIDYYIGLGLVKQFFRLSSRQT